MTGWRREEEDLEDEQEGREKGEDAADWLKRSGKGVRLPSPSVARADGSSPLP